MAGVRARRYCYPHCLLGKKVVSKEDFEALPKEQQEWAVTKEERDEAISKEDNLRDLYYHAYPSRRPRLVTAPTNAAWWSTSDGACNAAMHSTHTHDMGQRSA